MKRTFSLFNILFDSWYGISVFKYKLSRNNAEVLKLIGMIVLLIIGFSPLITGYTEYMSISYEQLTAYGQPGVIITLGIVFSSIIVLFFGFFYIISMFYFSSDTEHLVSMPLRPAQILTAKLGVILTSEYLTELPIMLPPVIVYGVKSGAGILYWIYSIIGMLAIPVIPLCIISILAVIVMRFTNIGRKKDLLSIIGSIIGVFIILGIQFYIQRTAAEGDVSRIQEVLFSENGLVNMVARNFPPAALLTAALIKYSTLSGFVNLLAFLGVSIIFLGVFEYFGEKLFFGGLIGSHEIGSERKKIDEREVSKEIRKKSRVSAVFWREFRMLNRVPVFFLNCVFPVFLIPVILVATVVFGGKDASSAFTFLSKDPNKVFFTTFGVIGLGIFTIVANMTAPTSISREGADFYISKYIPVSPEEQVLGKLLHAFMIAFAGNLLTSLLVGILFKLPAVNIILILVITTLVSVPIIEISLIVDLFRPYLNWDNPQRAVKQNVNGIFSMFFNMVWAGASVYVAARFIINPYLALGVLSVIYIILGVLFYRLLISFAAKRYIDIEV